VAQSQEDLPERVAVAILRRARGDVVCEGLVAQNKVATFPTREYGALLGEESRANLAAKVVRHRESATGEVDETVTAGGTGSQVCRRLEAPDGGAAENIRSPRPAGAGPPRPAGRRFAELPSDGREKYAACKCLQHISFMLMPGSRHRCTATFTCCCSLVPITCALRPAAHAFQLLQ
jgi:hypothetical protein